MYCSCVIFITSYEMDFHMLGILRTNICNGYFRKLTLLFTIFSKNKKKKSFSLVNISTLLFVNLNSKLKRRKVGWRQPYFSLFLCCKCAWVLDEKFVQIIVIDWIQFAFRHFFPWTWIWFKPCVELSYE